MKRYSVRHQCSVELALDLLRGKWTPMILAQLRHAPRRYSELRTAISGLSDKMLTERLRDLQEVGLVTCAQGGAGKSYALGPVADGLTPVLAALHEWGMRATLIDGRPARKAARVP